MFSHQAQSFPTNNSHDAIRFANPTPTKVANNNQSFTEAKSAGKMSAKSFGTPKTFGGTPGRRPAFGDISNSKAVNVVNISSSNNGGGKKTVGFNILQLAGNHACGGGGGGGGTPAARNKTVQFLGEDNNLNNMCATPKKGLASSNQFPSTPRQTPLNSNSRNVKKLLKSSTKKNKGKGFDLFIDEEFDVRGNGNDDDDNEFDLYGEIEGTSQKPWSPPTQTTYNNSELTSVRKVLGTRSTNDNNIHHYKTSESALQKQMEKVANDDMTCLLNECDNMMGEMDMDLDFDAAERGGYKENVGVDEDDAWMME